MKYPCAHRMRDVMILENDASTASRPPILDHFESKDCLHRLIKTASSLSRGAPRFTGLRYHASGDILDVCSLTIAPARKTPADHLCSRRERGQCGTGSERNFCDRSQAAGVSLRSPWQHSGGDELWRDCRERTICGGCSEPEERLVATSNNTGFRRFF